ncbi:MAG: cytochrome P450 [Myxococcota bacterium]
MQLSDVDLNDLDVFEAGCPHDMFETLRREAPVFWHEEPDGPGYWAVTRYDDLKHISRHPKEFSSERMGILLREPEPDTVVFQQQIMISMDPPRHHQHRALINKAFTPRMVEGLRPRIRRMCREIVNAVIEKGECDFVEELAAPLPMLVICEMMGVPEEDRRRVYDIGNKMVGFDDPEYHDGKTLKEKAEEGDVNQYSAEMFLYASKLREKAMSHPSDDLATALVNAELDGHTLPPEEFNFFFLLLLIAGNETTRTVTTIGMIGLLDHPDQLRDLKQDMSLLDGAIEEILRFSPAVHSFRRQTTTDVELRGQKIGADQKVILWYPSANRDEDVFERPQEFDIRRSPNEHVAFGYGEHYCLGANLARMELQEIFREILSRIDGMERTAKPRRLRSNFINGVKEMQVRFEPGAPL